MADPVSWLLIEPGWKVEAAGGEEVGRIAEVVGDSTRDIFDGVTVLPSVLRDARYVAAEQVAELTDGHVRLALGRAAFDALPPYHEPAAEIEIEPEKASLGTRMLGGLENLEQPGPRGQHIPLLRRVLLWFGVAGRR